jgi:hypothetical protein
MIFSFFPSLRRAHFKVDPISATTFPTGWKERRVTFIVEDSEGDVNVHWLTQNSCVKQQSQLFST